MLVFNNNLILVIIIMTYLYLALTLALVQALARLSRRTKILVSLESDQCAMQARLGVPGHLSTTPR